VNRIDRLSAILIQLQSKKVVKAHEIADRFDISLRTVYRDIRALEEAGVPIGAEAGVGYYINAEFHLPPVMFTKEEASAFLLAEKLVGKLSDSGVANAFESALYKVKSVLKVNEKEYLDSLNQKITVYNREPLGEGQQNLFLFDIQAALASKKVLKIGYTANYNKQSSSRFIEPVSLCNYDMRWHLIAYCRLRNAYRDFRLDRLNALEIQAEQYNSNDHLSLDEYFAQMTQDNSLINIQLRVHKSIADSLASSKYWFGLVEELKDGEYYDMKFAYSDLPYFAKWVLSMEDQVEILQPIALKDCVRAEVERLYAFYKPNIP